jgi:hypothetical protein
MRYLFLLAVSLLLISLPQSTDTSDVVVLTYKWAKTRQVMEKTEAPNSAPAVDAMAPQNRVRQRNARVNAPPGERDPNQDTLEGRSAAIEKNVQESRTPQSKPVDAFSYKVKFQNKSAQLVEILFWEYQFIERASPSNITRRQFLCAANIKAGKDKELVAFSLSGPSDVVSVNTLAKNGDKPFDEKVVVNRVEYGDGSIWQRKDWDFGEIRMTYRRAISTPWTTEMCRGL